MPGFWVQPEDVGENSLLLRGDEAHHLARVRRHRLGDQIEAVDGEGFCYRVRIDRIDGDEVEGAILERCAEKGESPVRLFLAPALIKGQRFDFVVEKATEVGVAAIVPTITERGIVQSGARAERKGERWQRLALAATKQCGRARVPRIEAPRSLDATLEYLGRECDAIWLATPAGAALDPAAMLTLTRPRKLGLLVGPEGGFTQAEEERARAVGAVPFAWGNRVLRADTACIVLAALVLYNAEEALKREGGKLG